MCVFICACMCVSVCTFVYPNSRFQHQKALPVITSAEQASKTHSQSTLQKCIEETETKVQDTQRIQSWKSTPRPIINLNLDA